MYICSIYAVKLLLVLILENAHSNNCAKTNSYIIIVQLTINNNRRLVDLDCV